MKRTGDGWSRAALGAVLVIMAAAVSGCGETKAVYPDKRKGDTAPTWGDQKRETIFGDGGLFDSSKSKGPAEGGTGIGVNSFLWRASLDTISFMPLSSADPFGGVIITDWYATPESPSERFKLTVLIMDRALRADGVRVSVFKQRRDAAGGWIDTAVEPKMATEMENSILTRARELRSAQAQP